MQAGELRCKLTRYSRSLMQFTPGLTTLLSFVRREILDSWRHQVDGGPPARVSPEMRFERVASEIITQARGNIVCRLLFRLPFPDARTVDCHSQNTRLSRIRHVGSHDYPLTQQEDLERTVPGRDRVRFHLSTK